MSKVSGYWRGMDVVVMSGGVDGTTCCVLTVDVHAMLTTPGRSGTTATDVSSEAEGRVPEGAGIGSSTGRPAGQLAAKHG